MNVPTFFLNSQNMDSHNIAILVIVLSGTLLLVLLCIYRCVVHLRHQPSPSNALQYEEI